MQLKYLLTGALLPLGLMANPTPEADVDSSLDARAFSRPQHCQIIGGATKVNCRSRPKTSSGMRTTLRRGNTYDFWCVRSGECVTINGFRNCGWHYIRGLDCYVSGHYTDNHCTLARLGSCSGDDDNDAADPF
ncbi:uncharacterized protein B0H64DRAFT_474291 [Chaetomium fimeti]|uniref:SH3 domain-containing protein n=1 Tax=Chaetomium fimeti TaxID=1854472 RepID=A0AAE0HF38_9PEZI|nr:hypothetical protein B0H64DRAFT_474291 [Chaetomium fimeti]